MRVATGGGKIPWADLRYIFGEIMYGGHIVNDFDRKMCATYLDFYMKVYGKWMSTKKRIH